MNIIGYTIVGLVGSSGINFDTKGNNLLQKLSNMSLFSYILTFTAYIFIRSDLKGLNGQDSFSYLTLLRSGTFIFIITTFSIVFAFFPFIKKMDSKNVKFF